MHKRHEKRRFAYNSFGETQNLIAFLTFFLFVAAYILGNMTLSHARESFDTIKKTDEVLSDDYIEFVIQQENTPTMELLLEGTYPFEIRYQNGQTLQGDLLFSDGDTVFKRMGINESMIMSASVNYKIVGSVLKYANISGDKFVFNSTGNPITTSVNGGFTLHYDKGIDVTLFPAETHHIEPSFVPDERSVYHLFMDAYITAKLQLILLVVGSLLLIYMIVAIMINTIKTPRPKPKPDSALQA